MTAALRMAGVGYSYTGEPHPAVDQVSLVVQPGEMVALTGPSGCGKSTLLLLAAGILPAAGGTVEVAGRTLSGCGWEDRAAVRAAAVGLVFQFGELVAELSLLDNVALAAELAGFPRSEALARSRVHVERVGLAGLEAKHPGEVSGGQAQRCALARALVHEPALLLCDEPTGALDSANAAAVVTLLRRAVVQSGLGVLVATHDERVAGACARRLSMSDGRIGP